MITLMALVLTRIANTWVFMRQSFVVIRSYRPLVVLPVISCIFCFLVSTIVLAGGALVFDIPIRTSEFAPLPAQVSASAVQRLMLEADLLLGSGDGSAQRRRAEYVWLLLLLFYVANYCVIVYFNVAFASIVLDRMAGGHATLDDGLQIAWARRYSVLQWALLAATVGVLLKMIRERSEIEAWIAGALGYIWRLATYFVMPLLALEDIRPGEALYRSAAILKRKWGEVIVAGFSFPLLFVVLAVPGVALIFIAGYLGQTFGFAATLLLSYWLLLAVIVFTTEQVFCVALYRYATEDRVSNGFSRTDLASAWEGLAPLPAGQAL